jgi:DNA-binding transcriptional LysR family regulator
MDLTLRQLRMLREVAVRGTIASAAEALNYTPSAVSQQLAGIEDSTGIAVLERVGRNVRLTDAGRELVRHAENVLDDLERARAALESVGQEAKGTVEMSIFGSIAATIMPPVLRRLADEHPELRVLTREMDPDIALESLQLGDLDLLFFLDYPHAPGPQPSGVERRPVAADWFRLVVPHDDPLGPGPIDLADLADREFIASPPHISCGRCVVQACREAGFEPLIRHQLDDYPASLKLVAAGAGIALVPDLGLVDRPTGLKVLELVTPVCRVIELAHRSTSSGRPGLEAVCATVLDVARDLDLDLDTAADLAHHQHREPTVAG